MSPRMPVLLSLLAVAAAPAVAQDAEGPLEIFRASDASLACTEIADEAAALSDHMGGRGGPGVISRIGSVAKSGAALLVPGAGLAMAGVDALTADQRAEREARESAIEGRWYYLNGLYAGRCPTPSSTPAEPAQAPVAPTTAASAPSAAED